MTSEEEPHLAAAFLTGAVKGGVAGALVAVLYAFLLWVVLQTRGGPDVLFLGRVVVGGALAGASLCGLDALSSRVRSRGVRIACRFGAGFLAPLAATMPQFGLLESSAFGAVSEAFLLEGRLADAERLASALEHLEPAARADLARRRGDPERCVQLAEAWMEATKDDVKSRGRSARANSHALIALARAEQGRLDEAKKHLEAMLSVSHAEPVFAHLEPKHLQAVIDASRASG